MATAAAMSNKYILTDDDQIVPCNDLVVWAKFFENFANRIVDIDHVGDVRVSTVFLGVDHRFFGGGPPVLFETMIFGGPMDGYQTRSCSMEEALQSHKDALAQVKEAQVKEKA